MASAVPVFPSTKETTNYARLCRLLVDVGSKVLRETFDKIHPPANLYAVLARPVVHASLQSLHRRKVLNPTQWGKLYPAIASSVSSMDFDITLLMILLRNICGMIPPTTGWDNPPAATDLSPEADIVRVKFYRNTIYGHASQASVDDAAFNEYWTDIQQALLRLGGKSYGAAIDSLRDECMDPDIEEHYQELLKQWQKREENIQDRLDEMDKKLEDLKVSIFTPQGRTPVKDPLDLQECQSQLRMRYNTRNQVKITPWDPDDTVDIDDIYTELSWLQDERKPTGKKQRKLEHYTEIFKGHKRFTNPKRIVVYGRPGIGKSTFSQKVAVDWASGKNETLTRFDLLLLIKLRDVCEIRDFPSILKASEVLACDGSITIASLYEYVLQNQDKVLLVLDGYDEYSPGTLKSSPIREIWEGNQLRDCHVVVTTRQMEGEELMKSSHVQCEIKGLDSKEQVNEFAGRFIPNPREIEEFNRYLDSRDLWEIAEIPLFLLMLCLIWMDRHRKALPKSRLSLHERFVETLLSHMAIKNPTNVNDGPSYNILDEYREDLSKIGKLALEGLLRNALYIDLKDVSLQSSRFTDKMVRSGLFQFSKLSSADPYKSLFFLHKSIQEFLAAWFIMNEVGLTEGKVDCFARIDSFQKALHLQEILKFMCEWSEQGARAVFSLLKFIGGKEGLTKCSFTKTPSVDDLSSDQRNFRYLSLQCLFSCSSSAKQVLYPLFLSTVGGVVLVNTTLDARKLAAEGQLISSALPSYIFFEVGIVFTDIAPLLDALHAVVITCSGLRLEASIFFRNHWMSSGFPKLHFFLKKQGDTVHFYFIYISWKYRFPLQYLETLKDLTTALPESQKKQSICDHSNSSSSDKISALNVAGDTDYRSDFKLNCLSLVISIEWECNKGNEELCVLSGVLNAVAFPRSVEVTQAHFRLFDARVVKNMVSHINITDNLYRLQLNRLNMAADDAAIIATSLHHSPNLHELELSDVTLHGSVSFLAGHLHHAPQLVDLTLFRVGMGYQECISLGNSLKHLPELQRLSLSYNSLGDGITKLAEHFRSVPRLRALGLRGINMGEEEATCLAHSLKHVSNLEEIYLSGNPLGRGVCILVQDIRNLPNLRKLDLENVVMTKKELDDVTAASREKRIKTSYHDPQGNLKPEDVWPVIKPVPEYLLSPMLANHNDGDLCLCSISAR